MNQPNAERRVLVVGHGYREYQTELDALRPLGVQRIDAGDPASATFPEQLKQAHAILVRETPIPRSYLDAAPELQVIVRYGIGVDNIDLAAARERRVYVANVPEYGIEDVSDHALALYLALARRIASRDRAVRQGAWNIGQREPMQRSATRCFGLVGYGKIARAFHRKIRALGVSRTLIHDPALREAPEAGELADLETLFAEADVVSLHAPLTPATHHFINAQLLSLMPSGAILINTARGPLIDEGALVARVEGGHLRVGLDVFEHEPPASDHPLFASEDALLSDHTGWYSEASVLELQAGAAAEIARVFRGETPKSWLNPWEVSA